MNGIDHVIDAGRRSWVCALLALAAAGVEANPAEGRWIGVTETKAVALAVHAVQPWLATARQSETGGAIRLYRVESDGRPASQVWASVDAPAQPPGVPPPMPVDLVFHPREPILYVRWDWTADQLKAPANRVASTNLGVLALYALTETGTPRIREERYLRGSLAATGMRPGWMAIDPSARRLYLPNLAWGAVQGLGALPLRTNGWPRLSDGEWVPVTVVTEVLRGMPNGLGFQAASDAVIFGTAMGPATWDAGNRLAPLGVVSVLELTQAIWVGGSVEPPVVYGLEAGRNQVCWMAQTDGYLTGRPRVGVVDGAAFCAPPAVITRPPLAVAAPSPTALHLLPIDAAGHWTGSAETLAPPGGEIREVEYGSRADRIYILQEAKP